MKILNNIVLNLIKYIKVLPFFTEYLYKIIRLINYVINLLISLKYEIPVSIVKLLYYLNFSSLLNSYRIVNSLKS